MALSFEEAVPIARALEKGDFSNTLIYTVPGSDGLFRRVSRDGRTGITAGEGNVMAVTSGGNREGEPVKALIELRRWRVFERALLVECGVKDLPF